MRAFTATTSSTTGILPLEFADPADYARMEQGDALEIDNVRAQISKGSTVTVKNVTKGYKFKTTLKLSPRLKAIVLAGGTLAAIAAGAGENA